MHCQRLTLTLIGLALLACGSETQQSQPTVPQGGTGGSPPVGSGGTAGAAVSACGLPTPAASGVAQPAGTPGGLAVLDWAGFTSAVSYTFDDANSSQIAHYDALQALGVPMTFYLQTNKSEASNAIWERALLDGHELGNHTQTHPQTGTAADVEAATAFIEQHFGVTPLTMAAPYGNTSYVALAETRFLINRGVAGGSIAPNGTSNPFNLPCHIPAEGAAASALDSVVGGAHSSGNWQIVLVHGFTGGTDGAYQAVDIDQFTSHVEHTKALGDAWIDSVINVGAYWTAQKLLSSIEPESAAEEMTWTWTLPAHFPPNQCLRVRVDGGTLTQDGAVLAWDPHGYYEIRLDAGSATLSP